MCIPVLGPMSERECLPRRRCIGLFPGWIRDRARPAAVPATSIGQFVEAWAVAVVALDQGPGHWIEIVLVGEVRCHSARHQSGRITAVAGETVDVVRDIRAWLGKQVRRPSHRRTVETRCLVREQICLVEYMRNDHTVAICGVFPAKVLGLARVVDGY